MKDRLASKSGRRQIAIKELWPQLNKEKTKEEREEEAKKRLSQLDQNSIRANKMMAIANRNRSEATTNNKTSSN